MTVLAFGSPETLYQPICIHVHIFLLFGILWEVGRKSISRFPQLATCVCFVLWAPCYGVYLDPGLGLRI
jgi:hypothetical protein